MKKAMKNFIPAITKKECTEFGQLAILVLLFFALKHGGNAYYIDLAFICMIITIVAPIIFYPFAIIWFSLSKVLSVVGPAIMLGIIFLVLVTPLGLFRRLIGHDSLRLRQFKKSSASVLTDRRHIFTAVDLLHTF